MLRICKWFVKIFIYGFYSFYSLFEDEFCISEGYSFQLLESTCEQHACELFCTLLKNSKASGKVNGSYK